MALALQVAGYIAAISLQILILSAMRNGSWRRYPFVFAYVVADLITNVIEIGPNLGYDTGSAEARRRWLWMYWFDERIIQALLFLLVISLIFRASTHLRPRRTLVVLLVSGSLLFALLSLWIHYNPDLTTGRWMTRWTRDMNFCAAILDLGLWAILLSTRQREQITLMLAGALGLQFTAGAIGQALRDISHTTVGVTSVLIVAANLACLYIWWQAFRAPLRGSGARTAPST